MMQIIRLMFSYPALYRFIFISGLFVLGIIFYFSSQNVSDQAIDSNISFSNNDAENTKEEFQENNFKEVIVQNGDTLNAILRNQNLPENEIAELIKLANIEKI